MLEPRVLSPGECFRRRRPWVSAPEDRPSNGKGPGLWKPGLAMDLTGRRFSSTTQWFSGSEQVNLLGRSSGLDPRTPVKFPPEGKKTTPGAAWNTAVQRILTSGVV